MTFFHSLTQQTKYIYNLDLIKLKKLDSKMYNLLL